MKIGINAWSFPTGLSLDEQLALAKRAGFDGYEPALDETGPLSLESSDGEIAAVRDQVTDAGLAITSLATGLYWKYPCTSDDPAIRDKSLRIIKRQLEAAALLNVDVVLVVPGCVYASFASSPPVQYDVAWDRALEALPPRMRALRRAHRRGERGTSCRRSKCTFIDTVNDPMRAATDVGNVQYGFPSTESAYWGAVTRPRLPPCGTERLSICWAATSISPRSAGAEVAFAHHRRGRSITLRPGIIWQRRCAA